MSSNFSIPGIGSGIDWSQYVSAMVAAEQQGIARTLGRRQAKVSAEQAAIGNIKGIMESLKSVVNGFEYAKDFKTKVVSSTSDTSISGTATTTAIDQSFRVTVNQLATNEVFQAQFSGVTNSVTATDQPLVITIRGTPRTLNVPAGTTLSGLADLINQQGWGISATVYDSGAGGATPARLSITDNSTGKADPNQTPGAYNLSFNSSLTSLATGAFTALIEGVDSQIWINGVSANPIYRDGNTVSDIFPGISLNLKGTVTDASITVTSSSAQASQKITGFIEQYNQIVGTLRQAIAYNLNETEQSNPTAGNATLRSVLEQLSSGATGSVNSLPPDIEIRSLADIGVTSQFDANNTAVNGQLEFDETVFNGKLNANYEDMVLFFEGKKKATGEVIYEGFGQKVSNIIESFLNSKDGSLTTKMKSLGEESERLDKEIQEKLKRLETKETMLKDKFARLEGTLSKLSGQQSSLNSALSAIQMNSQAIANTKK